MTKTIKLLAIACTGITMLTNLEAVKKNKVTATPTNIVSQRICKFAAIAAQRQQAQSQSATPSSTAASASQSAQKTATK